MIYELDTAQETRQLSQREINLRRELKQAVLGLTSLCRTMASQRAKTRQLREGDACTWYFHLQACHRHRKNYLFAINHNGHTFTEEEAKAEIVFSYYDDLLGTPFARAHRLDLSLIGLPTLDLADQVVSFSMDEIIVAVKETPSGRALGPNGLSGAFYKATWSTVGPDIVRAFQALWDLDFRSFHHLNEAVMVLLHKTQASAGLNDYSPISLIHSMGKLFCKCLALCLASRMHELVHLNQSTFIQGR
jgi:hypothetical protein